MAITIRLTDFGLLNIFFQAPPLLARLLQLVTPIDDRASSIWSFQCIQGRPLRFDLIYCQTHHSRLPFNGTKAIAVTSRLLRPMISMSSTYASNWTLFLKIGAITMNFRLSQNLAWYQKVRRGPFLP